MEKSSCHPHGIPTINALSREFQKKLGQLVEEHQLGEILFSPVDVVADPAPRVQPGRDFSSPKRGSVS